jgi:glutamyl-tRNA(Gln) amidotransferase subunit E
MARIKCGLEIHQRLASPTKLFCRCPNETRDDAEPVATMRRRLRAVAGELGQVDPSAAFEAGRTREFTYLLFDENTCLVEADDEPPREPSPEAVETSLKVSLMLEARVLDQVRFMRKTVVDGSAPSGFQRTALIAVNGRVKTQSGVITIPTICLEEESAGIVEQKAATASYRLDRSGVPLIEIATAPEITSGKQARETAEAIGMLLRSARGLVKRGIGTIRQDLNVSVAGGTRCEIKGVQELASLEAIVENEGSRQEWLLWIRDELKKRGAPKSESGFKSVAAVFSSTQSKLVRSALDKRQQVMAVKLEGFAGLLGKELMPGHRFGTELSDYAKAHAGVTGIIHSDEDLSKYGIGPAEAQAVANSLSCSSRDAWAACFSDSEARTVAGLEAVQKRALAAFDGVPKETRKAAGNISKFMRPLPGSARMYPETDVPPIAVDSKKLSALQHALPPSFEEQAKAYEKAGLQPAIARELVTSEHAELFEKVVGLREIEPGYAAGVLLQTTTALRREGVAIDGVPQTEIMAAFKLLSEEKIVKAAMPELLRRMAESGLPAQKVVVAAGLTRLPFEKVSQLVKAAGSFEAAMRELRLVAAPEDVKKALGIGKAK